MKAYWYKRPDWTDKVANVGDMLTPIVLANLLRKEIEWTDKPGKLLACGSLVELMQDGDVIWGSGLIQPMPLPKRTGVKILAVRGQMTRRFLLNNGYDCPEVYGDPGMLLPRIYKPEIKKEYEVGVVPHYVEKESFKYEGHYINVINNPFGFIDQILQCERIITSSLHAYILAIAYGIKAEYIQTTPNIIGGYFKYADFLTGLREYDEEKFIKSLTDGM